MKNLKLHLKIRNTSSPHLYLDQIKEMIKNDDFLLPAMRGYLNFMKKTKRSFIPLPLESEILILPSHFCNLTRGLSPQLTEFNKVEWNDSDIHRYKTNGKKFIEDIKLLYNKMGYEILETSLSEEIDVQAIIKTFEEKKKKFQEFQEKQSKQKQGEKKDGISS